MTDRAERPFIRDKLHAPTFGQVRYQPPFRDGLLWSMACPYWF